MGIVSARLMGGWNDHADMQFHNFSSKLHNYKYIFICQSGEIQPSTKFILSSVANYDHFLDKSDHMHAAHFLGYIAAMKNV